MRNPSKSQNFAHPVCLVEDKEHQRIFIVNISERGHADYHYAVATLRYDELEGRGRAIRSLTVTTSNHVKFTYDQIQDLPNSETHT